MTSWANIAEKNKNVKIVFKKVEEEKNEENEYIEEIYQIQKKQHFLDNYSQKISDLFLLTGCNATSQFSTDVLMLGAIVFEKFAQFL